MRSLALAFLPTLLLGQPSTPPAPASLEGSAVNSATGEPVRKAHATLRRTDAPPPGPNQPPAQPRAATTDNTGRFQFLDLEPGQYELRIRRDGFLEGAAGVRKGTKVIDPIVLVAHDRRVGLAVKMTPLGALAGRVVDEDGDPIQHLQVAAMTYRYTTRGRELVETSSAQTDDLGEYRIYNLAPAKYLLKVAANRLTVREHPEDIDTYVPVYYPGSPDPPGAQPIDLAPGQQLRNLNFALRRARYATLRGRIAGPPDAHLQIGLMVVTENGQSSTSTGLNDKEGKFALYGVPPGPVVITGSYYLPPNQHAEMRLPLEVGAEDINNIELRPLPPMDIPARVLIEGSTALKPSDLSFSLRGHNANDSSATPSSDGTLLFRNVAQDSYHLESSRMRDSYIKSVHWGDVDVTDGEFDVTGGLPPNAALSIVVGTDPGTLEATVTDDQNAPVEDAQVVLVPHGRLSRAFYRNASTDAAGHAVLRAIPPGDYQVFAFDQVNINAVVYDPGFLKPYQTAGQSLTVSSNDKPKLALKITINTQK